MTLEWFRDLVIVIWGLAATVAVIIIVVLVLVGYFKVRPIVDSVKSVARTVENISACVEQEIVGPMAQIATFVQGFRQAMGMFRRDKK